MAVTNQIHSIIVPWANAVFSAQTYSEVSAGVSSVVIINGNMVTMNAGQNIKITVRSISASTANVYLLGDNINLSNDSTIIGGSFTS